MGKWLHMLPSHPRLAGEPRQAFQLRSADKHPATVSATSKRAKHVPTGIGSDGLDLSMQS